MGVITAWLSSNTFHAEAGELTGKAKEIFETHEQMAHLTWLFSLVALIGKIASQFILKRKTWVEVIVSLFLTISAVTVSIAGHHGAMLVHMEGIGPMGKYLELYRLPEKSTGTTTQEIIMTHTENDIEKSEAGEQEEDHHVGELGKGPHGGTIEEADPFHMEIIEDSNNLIFYLLDDETKPLDMKNVAGKIKIQYIDKTKSTIDLMNMNGKLTAMKSQIGKPFSAICTLTKDGKSYSASFTSDKDLSTKK
ncbi:MAG: hypothetical protein IPQ03_12935 [Bacteroidetes bacterium]|nr:hypothetical protein [Bacteroidota bacterium]